MASAFRITNLILRLMRIAKYTGGDPAGLGRSH
jgi:hypothetical protein